MNRAPFSSVMRQNKKAQDLGMRLEVLILESLTQILVQFHQTHTQTHTVCFINYGFLTCRKSHLKHPCLRGQKNEDKWI